MAIIDGYPATSFDKKDREWIKAVADETASKVLPDTTEASAGDVLTVGEDGDAEWATPTDNNILFVDYIIGSEDIEGEDGKKPIISKSKTIAEMANAFQSGQAIIARIRSESAPTVIMYQVPLSNCYYSDVDDYGVAGSAITYLEPTASTLLIGAVYLEEYYDMDLSEAVGYYVEFNTELVIEI